MCSGWYTISSKNGNASEKNKKFKKSYPGTGNYKMLTENTDFGIPYILQYKIYFFIKKNVDYPPKA